MMNVIGSHGLEHDVIRKPLMLFGIMLLVVLEHDVIRKPLALFGIMFVAGRR